MYLPWSSPSSSSSWLYSWVISVLTKNRNKHSLCLMKMMWEAWSFLIFIYCGCNIVTNCVKCYEGKKEGAVKEKGRALLDLNQKDALRRNLLLSSKMRISSFPVKEEESPSERWQVVSINIQLSESTRLQWLVAVRCPSSYHPMTANG